MFNVAIAQIRNYFLIITVLRVDKEKIAWADLSYKLNLFSEIINKWDHISALLIQ